MGIHFLDMSIVQNNLTFIFQQKVSAHLTIVPDLEKHINIEKNKLKELQNKAEQWSKYAKLA